VLQPLALLLDLAGEAMRARLLVVQGEGEEESCLRPDFTIPVTRAHIAAGGGRGRYLYEGKAFRASTREQGHAREFLQIGLEAFGEAASPASDGEICATAWRAAKAGGRDDLRLTLGDVALFSALVRAMGLAEPLARRLVRAFSRPRTMQIELSQAEAPPRAPRAGDRVTELIAGLPEAHAGALLEDLWALSGIAPVGGRSAAEIVHRLAQRAEQSSAPRLTAAEAALISDFLHISDQPGAALDRIERLARSGGLDLGPVLADWQARLTAILASGVDEAATSLSTAFGRAFGYYDGFLFEVTSAALGADRAVAAGGRYDGLPGRLAPGGAGATRAVGCMVRPARAWAGVEGQP